MPSQQFTLSLHIELHHMEHLEAVITILEQITIDLQSPLVQEILQETGVYHYNLYDSIGVEGSIHVHASGIE